MQNVIHERSLTAKVKKLYLSCDEATEVPIDPATDDNHGENVGQVSLQHVCHH